MPGNLAAIMVGGDLTVIPFSELWIFQIFNIISDGQNKLPGHQAFVHQIQGKRICHFLNDKFCFLIRIRTLQYLASADAFGFRFVCLNVRNSAGFPAPCMVDQKFGVDTEKAVKQILIVIFIRLSKGASGNIPHRKKPVFFQFFRVTFADAPEIGQRPVVPKGTPEGKLIQTGDADSVFIRRNMLCLNIQCRLAEKKIGTDTSGGRNAGGVQHVQDDLLCKTFGRQSVSFQIFGNIHKHFVDGIHVDVFRSDIVQINVIDFCAAFHIMCHLGRSCQKVNGKFRMSRQLSGIAGFSGKPVRREAELPLFVGLLHFLDHLKQPCPSGNPVGLQGRGNGETYGFLRAAAVSDHKIGGHRIEAALHTLDRRIKRFQIYGNVSFFFHQQNSCIILYHFYSNLYAEEMQKNINMTCW